MSADASEELRRRKRPRLMRICRSCALERASLASYSVSCWRVAVAGKETSVMAMPLKRQRSFSRICLSMSYG